MPSLSVYIGESSVSALSFESDSKYKFGKYPYTFPGELIKNDFNSDKFFTQVLKYISKQSGLDLTASSLTVGTLSGISNGLKAESFVSIFQALSQIKNYNWLLAESFTVLSPENFYSYFPFSKEKNSLESSELNYLSNLSLYPQIVPSHPDELKAQDSLIKEIASNMKLIDLGNKPMVFTGGRFAKFSHNPIATFLLALDLLKVPGLHEVLIDSGNKFPLFSLLNYKFNDAANKKSEKDDKEAVSFLSEDIMKVNDEEIYESEFINVGTVLNAAGGVECLFEVEAGNSQFIDLKANKLFIFPLDTGEKARIVVDGKSTGHIETKVSGGSLGLVIDTREKGGADFLKTSSNQNKEWVKVINERISAF